MNKKFTKLMAALALLVFMMPSLAGWGQTTWTRVTSVDDLLAGGTFILGYEATANSGTIIPMQNQGTATTSTEGIMYSGTGSTSGNGTINMSTVTSTSLYEVTIVASTKVDGAICIKIGDNYLGNENTKNNCKLFASESKNTAFTPTAKTNNTFELKIVENFTYYDLQYNTGSPRFAVYGGTQKDPVLYKKEASDAPTCTINPTSWNFGNVQAGSATQTKNFSVTTANLTGDLAVELLDGTYYSVNVASIGQDETSKTITVTLDPTAVGPMEDVLMITGGGITEIDVDLTATGLCNDPTNALAYPIPDDQILLNGEVSYALNPTANTGNGGAITYTLTTNPGGNGEIINNNTFYAIGIGQYVVHAEQALYGTTCGGSADITINVFGPNQTITFDAGSGTCITPSITQNEGKTITLPTATPSEACVSKGWIFAGWAAASVSETTTAPTGLLHAGEDYLVTTSETLYAVYKNGSAFDNTAGGEFKIYAIVGANTYYATGTGSKISSTTNESEATTYTFEKPTGYGDGEFAIKTGPSYITYSGSTNLGTSTNAYKWTISQGTKGTWRATSGTSGRGLIFRAGSTNQFGGYSTGNVTQSGTEYYDIEIGGSTPPTYNSNPSCLPQVTTPTFSLEEGIYTGAQSVTIDCDTPDAAIYYKTAEEGTWQPYSAAITLSTTTTIWAMATKDGMDDSEVAEAAYTIQYTLTDGIENVTDYYLFDYHDEIWDDITPDENGHVLVSSGAEVRISGGLVEECYTLQGFYVVYGGNDTIYATYITEDGDNYYSFPMPASDAMLKAKTNGLPQHTLTVGTLSNVTLVLTAGEASDTVISGEKLCEGINVTIAATPANGYVMESVSVVDENNQSVEVTYQGTNDGDYIYSFEMPASDVAITATAVFSPLVTISLTESEMDDMTGELAYGNIKTVTMNNELTWETNGQQESTRKYIQIRARNGNNEISYIKLPDFNGKIETITMSVRNGSGNPCKSIVYFNDEVTNSNTDFIVSGGNTSSGTTSITLDLSEVFYSTGYLLANGVARMMRIDVVYRPYQDMTGNTLETIGNDVTVSIPTGANVTAENLTIPVSSGIVINSGATLTVNTLTNSGNANNIVVKDGGQLIFYAVGTETREGNEVKATMEKNIAAWTTNPVGGWYFIASPINSSNLAPSSVTNMITADEIVEEETVHTFDLYKYVADNVVNEESKPWYNYRAHEGFVIANGQGYLYANASDKTLAFAGAVKPYSTTSNTVTLAKTGWNLIGNPFTCEVSVNKAFSELNNGSAVTNKDAGSTIMPCAGIAVNGTENDVVTFTMVEPQQSAAPSNPSLQLTLAQQATNRGNAATLDNAIVSFDEGNELPKFYFMQQNANLYIPQGTKEYAIVSTEAQGTMPVNFRANANGQYTLTVNPENVEMNYLHLIDNMTGADIDLLQTPSYTFNANVTDYESRFKLVFATNDEDGASTGSATFAFYSNGNWIINNPSTGSGPATLQVVDITGRILSSETVNGSVSKTINATPGVYMLRLINGENVKVQKIVVR